MSICVRACVACERLWYVCMCFCVREYVYMSIYVRVIGCMFLFYFIWTLKHTCMLVCVCIWQTSSLPSVRFRMQSSPGGTEAHFFRWLTAVHVINNNICSAFIPHPNNFLYCSATEDGEATFIFICLNSLRAQLNEWMKEFYNLYLYRENSRVNPGVCSAASMVISTLRDDCLLRMRAIIPLLVKWELGIV